MRNNLPERISLVVLCVAALWLALSMDSLKDRVRNAEYDVKMLQINLPAF